MRALILVTIGLLALTSCRKRADKTLATSRTEPVGAAEAPAGENTYAAPPLPPPASTPPAVEAARFNTPEPMNMYAPRYAGDYQTQLDAYNRVLRKWLIDSSNAPRNLKEIMGTFNSPKPPQPPAGRQLVYDVKSKTVRLQ